MSGLPSLVPEGEYRLSFRCYRLGRRFKRGVLELEFAIADYGPYFDARLVRYYNVQASAKQRNFTAAPRSDFVREYASVFGHPPRFCMASLEAFGQTFVVGVVGTVISDHRQEPLPETLRYSTIRQLVRKERG